MSYKGICMQFFFIFTKKISSLVYIEVNFHKFPCTNSEFKDKIVVSIDFYG